MDTVVLWEVTSGQELATLQGHRGPLYSVTFSADGKALIATSDDGTIRTWGIAP
jgi:WD40 repeat protein